MSENQPTQSMASDPSKQNDSAPAETTSTAGQASSAPFPTRVFVTGASGFVGSAIVRELVSRGHKAVCLLRDRQRFVGGLRDISVDRIETVNGDLFDAAALSAGVAGADAVIHLVGIITEDRLRGQTFSRIHTEGTQRVVEATCAAGVRRYVHMSALGVRPDAVSTYHKTKWAAENIVRKSGLDWTIFRPSLIHGPGGEFMRMMKVFVCDAMVPALGFIPSPFPVIPYFGDGQNRLQPVSVKDVAHCFVAALSKPETIGKSYELGGANALSWKELYRDCRELIPGAKAWKPMVGLPVSVANLVASTIMKTPLLPKMLRFNVGQVQMSQEDSVCDITPVEQAFGIRMRDFRSELAAYAAQID
ncbi:MAG: complex I NDUFA9 subunit family protein [Phycisphaerae bacterium]|nr:complex I NDUFA9 subunit family protein [Phycisphaerae bacterium]